MKDLLREALYFCRLALCEHIPETLCSCINYQGHSAVSFNSGMILEGVILCFRIVIISAVLLGYAVFNIF